MQPMTQTEQSEHVACTEHGSKRSRPGVRAWFTSGVTGRRGSLSIGNASCMAITKPDSLTPEGFFPEGFFPEGFFPEGINPQRINPQRRAKQKNFRVLTVSAT
jgi:hypothetical protein